MAEYEIQAVRYAHLAERRVSENFIHSDEHDGPMPLDYFVWVVRGEGRTFIVDTGFDEQAAKGRNRRIVRPVADGWQPMNLKLIELKPVAE